MGGPTVGWILSYPLLRKKMPHMFVLCVGDIFSVVSPSSQVTRACIQLAQTQAAQTLDAGSAQS